MCAAGSFIGLCVNTTVDWRLLDLHMYPNRAVFGARPSLATLSVRWRGLTINCALTEPYHFAAVSRRCRTSRFVEKHQMLRSSTLQQYRRTCLCAVEKYKRSDRVVSCATAATAMVAAMVAAASLKADLVSSASKSLTSFCAASATTSLTLTTVFRARSRLAAV